jgi:lysophospholipase L1-like esterase
VTTFKISEEIKDQIYFQGRIFWEEDMAVLGYTNSSFTVHFKGTKISALLRTGVNEEVNYPAVRVYVDGAEYPNMLKEIILEKREEEFVLAEFPEAGEHTVRVVKITEAGMSYVGFAALSVEGELLPPEEDNRTKALFIGDSITCGYGVLGAPESEYTIREEDGELSYSAVLARAMNWNAEWVSVSGHGMFVEYTGDPENILPREFPYTNWFYNKERREDYSRFQPDMIIVNLGTNDSGPMAENPLLRGGFKSRYESFLYTLRLAFPKAKIVCVMGTLATGVYPYVQEVIDKVLADGLMTDVYGLELPYHDVEHDGVASGHPTAITHEKDAKRIEEFIRNIK